MEKRNPFFRLQKIIHACVISTTLAVTGCGSDDSTPPTVEAPKGTYQGLYENNHAVFKGIQYAQNPSGSLRFKAPVEIAEFTNVKMANEYGPNCPQKQTGFGDASTVENCLYLNVFSPDIEGNFPVMVWIHGGAFVSGSGSDYDPSRLVDKGIVVVTLNYRLGALGFLSHSELSTESGMGSGNYGLMDQQLALKWVQDNIEFFGGDKSNVTIFGESAGGHSVTSQIVANADADPQLFHKAIIQSGNYHLEQLNPLSAESAYVGGKYASDANCTTKGDVVSCLRALSVEAILEAQTQTQYIPTAGTNFLTQTSNAFLPVTAENAIKNGDIGNITVMNGTNLNEGTLFTALEQLDVYYAELASGKSQIEAFLSSAEFLDRDNNDEHYITMVETLFANFEELQNNHSIEDIASEYYEATDDSETDAVRYYKAASKMHTDWRFACTALKTNEQLAEHITVYSYHFTDTTAPNILTPFNPVYLGATHASEIQYILSDGSNFNDAQSNLSAAMIEYWTTFAKTGNPNSNNGDLLNWPSFESQGNNMIDLNTTLAQQSKDTFNIIHNCDYWLTSAE